MTTARPGDSHQAATPHEAATPHQATTPHQVVSPSDLVAMTAQLGRQVRDVVTVAHRCECGLPDVVATSPRLADGTPFPTTFYLTCPRAASAIGTLEASGLMREMSRRLMTDDDLADGQRRAHQDYLRRRAEVGRVVGIGEVAQIAEISAGGMPDRVKCLHVLVAHALAAGPGVNPLGDEAIALLAAWGRSGPCVEQPIEEVHE